MGNPVIRLYEQADEEHKVIATDYFGNEIYPYDQVMDIDGDLLNLEHITIIDVIDYLKKECGARIGRMKK